MNRHTKEYIDNSTDSEIIKNYTDFFSFSLKCNADERKIVETALKEFMLIVTAREEKRRRVFLGK